jgi:hypothetical protein
MLPGLTLFWKSWKTLQQAIALSSIGLTIWQTALTGMQSAVSQMHQGHRMQFAVLSRRLWSAAHRICLSGVQQIQQLRL